MHDAALQEWLRLTLSWRFNATRLKSLLSLAGSVSGLKTLAPARWVDAGLSAQNCIDLAAWQSGEVADDAKRLADAAMDWALKSGNRILTLGSPDYPPLLAICVDPPPQLFVRGNAAALSLPQLAMVGSRKPTADGRRHARQFAAQLVERGYQVTSGLALGIDAESHEGALLQNGVTLAVLGSGLNRIYPPGNMGLAERIAERGALISEFPPDAGADTWHFPERNRIISGLSHGVLVVEAAERSGSLITARVAAEQGREVFAIPGSINNPMARGCHRLIRQGATLVENVDDILAELPNLVAWERAMLGTSQDVAAMSVAPPPRATLPEHGKQVLHHIAYDPVSIDSLALHTALPVHDLLGCLLQLEMLGLVTVRDGSYVLNAP